jgi:putative thioredoxin
MAIDVTDATFQTEVIERSAEMPVLVDLWAPWCGPCRTLGPIIEKVVDDTQGQVVLVKVNIDENPGIAEAFGVQSIPLVVALKDGQPIDGFLGALPEQGVRQFVDSLLPTPEELSIAALIAAGDEASLRQVLAIEPGHDEAVLALAELLIDKDETDEALALLARIPETERVRQLAAQARLATTPDDDYDDRLAGLLDRVKADEAARQEFVDLLEVMGPDDPRTAGYRRQLTSRLF